MSTAISLRPEMGETILAHLGKMAKLPKFGVVAGQAVASAIEDLWGAGGGVYNDLDVFIPSSGRYTSAESRANHMPMRGRAETKVRSGYGGSVQRHLEMVQTYRIEEVKYTGMLNRIYFQLPDKHDRRADDHAERVIEGFDINAVRVGIDLRSRKLVWDAHYEQFLANRELRIAACYTPAHSLIRLLKKADELPNVTADVETAARIVAMLQTEGLHNQLSAAKLVSYLFGDKFTKLAEAHHSQWQAYYELDDEWFHQPTATGGWRRGCGDETSQGLKVLRRMTPRGELDVQDQAFARELGTMSVIALPAQVYRQRDARNNGFVSMLTEASTPEGYEDTHLPHFAQVRGPDYFEGLAGEDSIEELRVFSHSSWARFTMGWSGAEQLAFEADRLALEKALGVPDVQEVLSWVAHDAVPFSLERLEAEARKYLVEQRKPAHKHIVPLPDMAECPLSGANRLELFELSSERELREFKAERYLQLYEPEGHWGHRYFVLQDPARAKVFAVVQVKLDSVDTMTSDFKLKHNLNRYLPTELADFEMLKAASGWLRSWWAAQGHVYEAPEEPSPDIPF